MGVISYNLDRFMQAAASVYLRLMGGPLRRLAVQEASFLDKVAYGLTLAILAGVLLLFTAAVEFMLDSYLRVFALAWVVGVFFFLAGIDLRARRILSQ